jgi:hypothetical protein
MHDTVPEPDYEWPSCVSCGCDLWTAEWDRLACRPCGERTAARIAELPALFRQLDTTAALMKGGSRGSSPTSGSRTPPIPPRLDVLNLVSPGGVVSRLSAIEDAWRQALGWTVAPWRGSPAQAIPGLAAFLGNNLLWACSSYDEIGQDIDDLRRLHAECSALVRDERRPGRVQIGNCPTQVGDQVCWTPLTASAASHRVRCSGCGGRWETIGEWRELRAAQEAVLAGLALQQEAEVAGAAA